jgi:two-component system response regulator AtoC
MRHGAFNYLLKPFSPDTIEAVIEKAREHLGLVEENTYLRQQLSTNRPGLKIIAESASMQKVLQDAKSVASSNANVFIHGESGTGKEVVAQVIHNSSPRSNRPFIKVNCAAVPETLIESEFFGHEKGAFTGATARRLGRFELANGGTLLLDEITETPLPLQAKLLRVTQEMEFERVGGSRPIKVDVRLISTSNREMKEAIAEKRIREDLYYRLNVVPIFIPPLRDRKEDIIPLAEYFLEKTAAENHREKKQLSPEAKKKLLAYNWPGNVRELANVIERAVVLDSGKQVSPAHLFIDNFASMDKEVSTDDQHPVSVGMTLQELEKRLIIDTLLAQQNNKTKAAELLGISPKILNSKISKHNL